MIWAWIVLLLGMFALSVLLVRQTRLLYIALGVLAMLLGVAAVFALCGAEFLAAAQLVVYAGGIMVLLTFGLMLSQVVKRGEPVETGSYHRIVTGAIGFVLFGLLAWGIYQADFAEAVWIRQGSTQQLSPTLRLEDLGELLMTEGLVPLELVGVLLTVVLVGATRLASRNPEQ